MNSNATGAANPRGSFTLTEVMIGVLVMMVSLGALLFAFVAAKRSDALAQVHLAAQQTARAEVERILTNSYSNIVSVTNAITNEPLSFFQGRSVRRVTTTTNYYKDISIVVEWIGQASANRRTLTNYMTVCDPQ